MVGGYPRPGHFIPVAALPTIMIGMRQDTLPTADACREKADVEARVSRRGAAPP